MDSRTRGKKVRASVKRDTASVMLMLLLTTSYTLLPLAAHAQVRAVRKTPAQPTPRATPHATAAHAAAPATAVQSDPEAITVSQTRRIAGGLMKRQHAPEATSSITAAAIAQKLTIASPIQLAATLPGANVGMSDAYGLSIRNDISVRGYDETEMGWVVEGVPGIDQAYLLPYSETWADNENLSDVTLIASTSRINDPVQSASGGEMIETVRDPSNKMGGDLSYSHGSYRGDRVFARYDSGYIGNTGIKMFASYSYTAADVFAGSGRSRKNHVDFKLQKDWGDIGRTSLFVSYTDWTNARSSPYTLAAWEKANAQGNNFSVGNYASSYVAGETSDYWKNYVYRRSNVLISLQNQFRLTHNLRLNITPYFHWTESDSPGQTSFSPDSLYNGSEKVSIDTSGMYVYTNSKGVQTVSALANAAQTQFATGVNAYVQYDPTPHNHLIAGYWYDHWNMTALNGLSALDQNGNAASYTGGDLIRDTAGDIVTGTRYQMSSDINEFYLSDTQGFLHDRLKISAGFKEMMYYLSGTNELPGSQYHYSQAIAQPMPRVSISYDVRKDMQVYINGTTNARPPVPLSTYPNLYSISSGNVTQQGTNQGKMEYAINEEIGFRYHGLFNADVALFNSNLTNHQVTTMAYVNGASVNSAISVGGETMRGVTVELSTRPFYGISPYVNAQYLHATMDNNFSYGGVILPTAGKVAVKSPKFMANIGVMYARGPFFANLMFKWVDSQYSTFMDDQSMPAYKTVDLSLGYRLPKWSAFSRPVIKLNFMNLTNTPYLSSVGTVTANAVTTRGVAGQTPSYFLAPPLSVVMTASCEF